MKRTDPSRGAGGWLARARTLPDDVSETLDEVRRSAAATKDSVDVLVAVLAGLAVLAVATFFIASNTHRLLLDRR